jgi:hypothetical protein
MKLSAWDPDKLNLVEIDLPIVSHGEEVDFGQLLRVELYRSSTVYYVFWAVGVNGPHVLQLTLRNDFRERAAIS